MDPIRLSCPHCQSGLKAPAQLAGRTLKCPKCGQPLQVPAAEPESPEVVLAQVAELQPAASPDVAWQVCPHCQSQIPAAASKCRHCGEFVAARAKRTGDSERMQPAEYVVAFLLAPVGLGVGVLWAIQHQAKAGRMMLISAAMSVVWIGIVLGAVVYMPGTKWANTEEIKPVPLEELYGGVPDMLPPSDEDPRPSGPPALTRPPEESDLQQQPLPIQRAMRANVRIVVDSPYGKGQGAGVILDIQQGAARVLTNRHVVDPLYAMSRGAEQTRLEDLRPVEVTYVTGDTEAGKVIWMASDGVDLALVRGLSPQHGIAAADWDNAPTITQGQDVFAIGNPAGLGWTLTRGTVSGLRMHEALGQEIPVIQTDAAINPGNSGGGLYNAAGQLIGINNFIVNPELARNVGFAIRFAFARDLVPAELPRDDE